MKGERVMLLVNFGMGLCGTLNNGLIDAKDVTDIAYRDTEVTKG
jgi:hypothetical protein